MMSTAPAYQKLVTELQANAHLAAALRLLEWDQETYMPSGVAEMRAEQIGVLTSVLHERQTAPALLDLVDALAANLAALSPEQSVDVRETKWRLDRVRALPPALVHERATLHAQARSVWIGARRDDDFAALEPYLTRIFEVERMVARAIDASRPAYDVLLEEYEPGADTATVSAIFAQLRGGLQPLVDRLQRRLQAKPLVISGLKGHFPSDEQLRFNQLVAARLGFDFDKGRLDAAAHPFTTSIGTDVRITTRYDEGDLRYSLFSTIHESGHALYEQGLDPALLGTPRGEACSLAVHESQSRLWENIVARSPAFWRYLLPIAQKHFSALAGQSVQDVVLAANEAGPSLIRTESDELTYNLHIILRFELERDLIDGNITVAELPEAWRARMQAFLGVVPDNDRDGCLQDVHWPSGAIGYFPTYALGNIYAAQLFESAHAAIGNLDIALAGGDFAPLLAWLREHIHRLGQTYRAPELIHRATGRAPDHAALLNHLARKVEYIEAT